MTCQQRLRQEWKPYPRTCEECGLGPCKYGLTQPPFLIRAEQQRIVDEKTELDGRIERLESRICAQEPGLHQDLMRRQLWAMRAYSSTLRQQIEAWN